MQTLQLRGPLATNHLAKCLGKLGFEVVVEGEKWGKEPAAINGRVNTMFLAYYVIGTVSVCCCSFKTAKTGKTYDYLTHQILEWSAVQKPSA